MSVDSITLRSPDDFHVHLREGDLLRRVLKYSSAVFRRVLVMPNTKKPILTPADAIAYRYKIQRACLNDNLFTPLMTIKLTHATTPQMIWDCKGAGVVAAKLYPVGVTTNSSDGVDPYNMHISMSEVFRAMQDTGLVLCVHAELPGVETLHRERMFFQVLNHVIDRYPDLRVVVEHVSSRDGVEYVRAHGPNVAATITAHHLMLTLDDVIGDKLQPHNFCKPIPKGYDDRLALRRAAMSGDPKFFFGSDSAPHYRGKKECVCGAAGVYSAPVALECLAHVFNLSMLDDPAWVRRLETFTSVNGANFYGLPLNQTTETLTIDPWKVPTHYQGVVPLQAGELLRWRRA